MSECVTTYLLNVMTPAATSLGLALETGLGLGLELGLGLGQCFAHSLAQGCDHSLDLGHQKKPNPEHKP